MHHDDVVCVFGVDWYTLGMSMTFKAVTPKDLQIVIDHILAISPNDIHNRIIALSGDLGVGKTTFVQQLAEKLGVRGAVTSPTFTIMKQYETAHSEYQTLIHIDLYRVVVSAELAPLRVVEQLKKPNKIICVEWPERAEDIFPADTIRVTLSGESNQSRTVVVEFQENETE
jgi:tRNA threonylcarbamoyladenosine biosynthesis protein TsaE